MLKLSAPQHIFLNELNTKYRAYVGGFGSGKTFVGCLDLAIFALKHPKAPQGYFAPTFGAVRDIFYPTFEEAADLLGFRCEINTGNKEVHLFRGRWSYGTIICRTMDNPASIVGFKVARSLVDEIDIMPKKKAEIAWRKIIARLRYKIDGVVNGVGVTTTPEGFNFVYERFAKNPTESYSMVQASTYENAEYLPDDYIETLLESYPSNIISAYIKGNFVNLTSGSVYGSYDRLLNHSNREWQQGEPIHVGIDFNVGKMAAIIHVIDNGNPIAVDEISDGYDTPDVIKILHDRYQNTKISVYPDAAGQGRSTKNASTSDLALLQQAGFNVVVNGQNPRIRDRVISMNNMFLNNKGERRYKVNSNKCKVYADNLEQQVWSESGEPDKSAGKDHTNDAGGYCIWQLFPVEKPASNVKLNFAR
jgi:hypothetical protein